MTEIEIARNRYRVNEAVWTQTRRGPFRSVLDVLKTVVVVPGHYHPDHDFALAERAIELYGGRVISQTVQPSDPIPRGIVPPNE